MMSIDFFADGPDEPPHPLLRSWKRRLALGATAKLQVYSPKTIVGLSQPRMFVEFSKDGDVELTDETDWDQALNAGLLQLRVSCINPDNEAERFALGLRDGFQSVENEYGNGFFNSVLIDLIKESGLDGNPEIGDLLKHTHHDPANQNSRSYSRCREALALAISARAKELKNQLGYEEEEARAILTRALGVYLDERFSVSSRRQLGLI